MEDNSNKKNGKDNTEKNDSLDLFEKYNTYYTLSIIISYLDEKSLYNLMCLKRRFYELIQDKLNTDDTLYLPLFDSSSTNTSNLFITYYISIIKGIKNKNSEKEKQKVVFNILKNLENNTLNIQNDIDFFRLKVDYYLISLDYRYEETIKEDINDKSISLKDFTKKYEKLFKVSNLNFIKTLNLTKDLFYDYFNYIYYILKLHKYVFNQKTHRPKFEKIIIEGGLFDTVFSLVNKNNEWYLHFIDSKITKSLGKYIISNNTELEYITLNNEFVNILDTCDLKTVKKLKIMYGEIKHLYNDIKNKGNKINFIQTTKCLEYVELIDVCLNYDDLYALIKNSKKFLKKIILNKVYLNSINISEIKMKNITLLRTSLKNLEYAEFDLNNSPSRLIYLIINTFLEVLLFSKSFTYFKLINKDTKSKTIVEYPIDLINKIKKEPKIIEDKISDLKCTTNLNKSGFYVSLGDFDYELYKNENNEIISKLIIKDYEEKSNIIEMSKNIKNISKLLSLFIYKTLIFDLIKIDAKLFDEKTKNKYENVENLKIRFENRIKYKCKKGLSIIFEKFPNIINLSFEGIQFLFEKNKNEKNNTMNLFLLWIEKEYKIYNKKFILKSIEFKQCLINDLKINSEFKGGKNLKFKINAIY